MKGFHQERIQLVFRVLACEGCKSFWKRTIQRGASHLYRCRAGTLDCPVYTGTRSRCQQCRLQTNWLLGTNSKPSHPYIFATCCRRL